MRIAAILTALILVAPAGADDKPIKTFADWKAKYPKPDRLTDAALAELPPGVTDLDINDCGKVTDAGIAHLKSQGKLRKLAVFNAKITADGLKTIGTLTHLEDLTINSDAITDADLVHLAPLQKLRNLTLLSDRITPAATAHFGALSNLEVLVCDIRANDATLPHFSKLTKLKKITCDGEETTDRGAVLIGKMAGLESLWMSRTGITDVALEAFGRLPNLKELRMYSCDGVTHRGITHLGKLPALQELHLFCKNACGPGIADLKNAPSLRKLHVNHLSAEHAKHLAPLTQLDYLALYGEISDAHLDGIKSLTKLEVLYASGKGITSLTSIAGHTKLKELDLNDSRLTDAGSKPLANFTKLRILKINAADITSLKPIEKLKELETVALPKGIDDTAIDILIGLPNLKSITVNRNINWTQAGVDRLIKAFPKARIEAD